MNLSLITPTLTPVQEVEALCAALPERFRLTERLEGLRSGDPVPFSFRSLQVNWGPRWESGGICLDDGESRLQEVESPALAFEAVSHYCLEEEVILILSVNVAYDLPYAATISRRSTADGSKPPLFLGKGHSAGEAGMLALSRALRAWGQA